MTCLFCDMTGRPKIYATKEERNAARRKRLRVYRRRDREQNTYRAHDEKLFHPDPQAVAEREERERVIRENGLTLSQLLLGDPAPGRSALESKINASTRCPA